MAQLDLERTGHSTVGKGLKQKLNRGRGFKTRSGERQRPRTDQSIVMI